MTEADYLGSKRADLLEPSQQEEDANTFLHATSSPLHSHTHFGGLKRVGHLRQITNRRGIFFGSHETRFVS
jgi:hypothetical protein